MTIGNDVAASDQGLDIRHDKGMPPGLVYWGIGVGLLLCVVGMGVIVFYSDRVPQPLSALTMCVGFGIVLAAFGSQASAKWGGWAVIGGSGAITVILFTIVQHYIGDSPTLLNKRGLIGGQLSKVTGIRVIDNDPLYMRYDKNNRKYRFIIQNRKFEAATVSIEVDTTEKGRDELITLTAPSDVLAKKYLATNSGIIEWYFDYANRQVKDGTETVFRVINDIDESDIIGVRHSSERPIGLISIAQAQGTPSIEDLNSRIEQLKDDDASTRRSARDILSGGGPEIITALMQALRRDPTNYRMRLGVAYALNSMIKRKPELALSVSGKLSQADLDLLQASASDQDPTVRLQATEFLYRLADKRTIDYAINNIASPQVDEKSKSNSALILKGTYTKLPVSDQKAVFDKIERLNVVPNSRASTIIQSIR